MGIDELSDGTLIANYEKNKGVIVLESGTYYRNKTDSPSKFIQSVREAHYAWQDSKRVEEARKAELSNIYSGGGSPSQSGDDRESVQSTVQESEVDMEAAIEEQVSRARNEVDKCDQELEDAVDLVNKLETKINRLRKAVSNGEMFLEQLRAKNVPPETTS